MLSLRELLDDAVTRRQVPSISVAVQVAGTEAFHHTVGSARLEPPRPAAVDQPYDLASVTKVLAGTAVIASLVEDGTLSLDTPAAEHLDGVDPRVTVRHLLQHGSGLPAWHPFYADLGARAWGTEATRRHLYQRIRSVPLEVPPDTRHTYSDVGFLWLLMIAEASTGTAFSSLFHQRVTVPSGVSDLRWSWAHAAATEWPCPHRGIGVEGTVHDLNCASLGGVSTHAGLFGTARAVASIGTAFMDSAAGRGFPDLPGSTLARFWSEKGPGSHRCGWDGISRGGYTSTGTHFPDDSVGHLGYTGTSIWLVPSRRTSIAVLTNRVHPIDDTAPIRALRPVVHDAIAYHLGWTS